MEELVRELGKIFPSVPIWVGGPEVSYDTKDVLERLPEVTGVIFGEGEKTFLEVVEYYHGKDMQLSEIKGIAYRGEEGEFLQNSWREVMDLSEVPFVYHDMAYFKNKIIYYESSRGCPFSCSYCLSSIDKCLRFRKLELVEKELQFFIDEEVPQVKFVDRTFNCNHKHAIAIWKYIKEHDKGITNFHFEVAADLLNEEELKLIESMRPGLIQLEIGVQSTNEQTIREIRRTMRFEEVARIVQRINQGENVHQHLDLIAGLPYEGMESFQKSFDDVYRLHPEQLQLGFLKVLKGSYMESQKDRYGLVYKSRPPYEVLNTNWLSYEEMMRLKSVEEMVEVYYNSGQFSYCLRKLEEEYASPFVLYQELGRYYENHELHLMSHSRITRYEILLGFVREKHKERERLYRELLTFDLYFRENVKKRPEFAGEHEVSKDWLNAFYETESKEHQYLIGYEAYDKRQLRKMTHIEKFQYDVLGTCEEKEKFILFDYQNRSRLTHQAAVTEIETE